MRTVTLNNGEILPALGMGTWNMGDSAQRRDAEIESLRAGIDAGIRVIDTAEMYGNGRSETLVGAAIEGRRDDVFLVSKVLPSNASRRALHTHCRQSLERLNVAQLDLYLLHWRGGIPLAETVEGMEALREEGLIRGWGVSNFDVDDMEDLEAAGGSAMANQILYNLEYRGVEFDLLARDRAEDVLTMAYSPLGQGGEMLEHDVLRQIAARHETSAGRATPAQIALAWVLRQENMLVIPKAGTAAHLRENARALEIDLASDDLKALDAAFPPPGQKKRLAMI